MTSIRSERVEVNAFHLVNFPRKLHESIVRATHYVPAQEPATRRGMRLVGTMFGSLLLLTVILMILSSKSVESEITSALGCRSTDEVLIVEIQRDSSVRWPNGDTCTIDESVRLLPGWFATHHEPVLAIKADKDILMSTIHPLLDTAKELGMQQAIFAASDQGPVRIYRR